MLVVPESLDASAKRHERVVDLSGFLESIPGGFGPVVTLAPGQVDQRKLRNRHLALVEENLFARRVERGLEGRRRRKRKKRRRKVRRGRKKKKRRRKIRRGRRRGRRRRRKRIGRR